MTSILKDFKSRLALGFLMVVTLLGGAGAVCIWQLTSSEAKREMLTRDHLNDVIHAEQMRGASDGEAAASRGYLLTHDPEFLHRFGDETRAFEDAIRALRAQPRTDLSRTLLSRAELAGRDYRDTQSRLVSESSASAE